MGKLTYSMMISLDGYISDAHGNFDWGQIDEEVHQHANEEVRRASIYVYGRRMYETMVYWETAEEPAESLAVEREFASIWRAADKIVVSKNLVKAASEKTRIVTDLSAADMKRLKANALKDVGIGGPTIAAPFIASGLVDEIGIYYVPVVVGAGAKFFQGIEQPLRLERIEARSFSNGVVFVRYRTGSTGQ
jgi:dihydrofolate reductase